MAAYTAQPLSSGGAVHWTPMGSSKDAQLEENLIRNPNSLKNWWYFLDFKMNAPPAERNLLYERALHHLPGSYKLWFRYLHDRIKQVEGEPLFHKDYDEANTVFEQALVFMHKMPRIWLLYAQFLTKQRRITRTRHVFDRALRALPVTQHKILWPSYLEFAKNCGVPETAMRVYRRFLIIRPEAVEDFIELLLKVGRLKEAAMQYAAILNDERFNSQHNKSRHELWLEFLDLIVKHPAITSEEAGDWLNVEEVVRAGLRRFPHETGKLWAALADHFIRQGLFEKARDVLEEGMAAVATVRDFSVIFDMYAQFSQSVVNAEMEELEELAEDGVDTADDETRVDLRLARLEALEKSHPFLLSSVVLRQNPHNVKEWHKRAHLHKDTPLKVIQTFSDAVTTVDPAKATGRPQTLWIAFAKYYELHEDVENARIIFEKATQVNYKTLQNLAAVWAAWAEMELRNGNEQEALQLVRNALVVPSHVPAPAELRLLPVKDRLFKSTRLWSLMADLEESFGTVDTTKAVYEQMVDLKVMTPQLIINYATFLHDNRFFEASFRAFERGLSIFKFPHALPIWMTYLRRFVLHYKGKKVERARDLFEQAVATCPQEHCRNLYLLYAKFEEDYGLARRAMAIFDRACGAVGEEQRMPLFRIYINRAAALFGVARTREIFEKAVNTLETSQEVKQMCLQYAALERKMGEVDRARAIYTHAAQYCPPKVETEFWQTWHDFEVAHGNPDTVRELLRIRRSVHAEWVHTSGPHMGDKRSREESAATTAAVATAARAALVASNPMAALEAEVQQEQAQGGGEEEEEMPAKRRCVENTEEIALPEEDSESESELATKPVPAAVFGGAAAAAAAATPSTTTAKPMGALERLRKAQQARQA